MKCFYSPVVTTKEAECGNEKYLFLLVKCRAVGLKLTIMQGPAVKHFVKQQAYTLVDTDILLDEVVR